MSDPAITVRPIGCMMGPHHLNEVFFDDLRVTEADVLGTVDDGWSIVQDVLAFERVGIARYARCERLLQLAPKRSASGGMSCPPNSRALGPHADPLPPGPTACLPTGRAAGRGTGQAHRLRRLPHRRHQARPGQRRGADGDRRRASATTPTAELFRREVEDHWRYSQASTVSSGSIEMQRILLSRTLLAAR